jgi:hypothetical protein
MHAYPKINDHHMLCFIRWMKQAFPMTVFSREEDPQGNVRGKREANWRVKLLTQIRTILFISNTC